MSLDVETVLNALEGIEVVYAELQAALPGTVKTGGYDRVQAVVREGRRVSALLRRDHGDPKILLQCAVV